MVSVLSGPQSNFGAFNFRPPQKTSFFSRRPLASSKKKNLFFSRRPSVKAPKLDSAQRELIPYYYKLKHF